MIVISDTTPLNYLILVGCKDIVEKLFSEVVVPEAVFNELQHADTPDIVRLFIQAPPQWLRVRSVTAVADPSLRMLEIGEREAIILAEELKADLILMDDANGRQKALQRNLPVIGTLGVLEKAAIQGLLDLPTIINKLKATNFRASDTLYDLFLKRDLQRKRQD